MRGFEPGVKDGDPMVETLRIGISGIRSRKVKSDATPMALERGTGCRDANGITGTLALLDPSLVVGRAC